VPLQVNSLVVSEDIDLDVLDGFGAFIGYLGAKIVWLLLVA
jgi:hypothetical protein